MSSSSLRAERVMKPLVTLGLGTLIRGSMTDGERPASSSNRPEKHSDVTAGLYHIRGDSNSAKKFVLEK